MSPHEWIFYQGPCYFYDIFTFFESLTLFDLSFVPTWVNLLSGSLLRLGFIWLIMSKEDTLRYQLILTCKFSTLFKPFFNAIYHQACHDFYSGLQIFLSFFFFFFCSLFHHLIFFFLPNWLYLSTTTISSVFKKLLLSLTLLLSLSNIFVSMWQPSCFASGEASTNLMAMLVLVYSSVLVISFNKVIVWFNLFFNL